MIKQHKLYRLMIANNMGTPVLHSDDAKPAPNVLSLQALPAKTNRMETPKSRHHNGRTDLADVGFSWEAETMKMVLLFSKSIETRMIGFEISKWNNDMSYNLYHM